VTEPFHRVGPSNRTGTRIRYRADPDIFGSARLDVTTTLTRLKTLTWLTPDLTWSIQGNTTRSGGLVDCLLEGAGAKLLPGSLIRVTCESALQPNEPADHPFFRNRGDPKVQIDAVIGLAQNAMAPRVFAFLNYAPLTNGSHVVGVLEGIERAFPGRMSHLGPRVIAAVHLGLLHPVFEGPTRAGLHVPEVQHLIANAVFDSLSVENDTRIAWLDVSSNSR